MRSQGNQLYSRLSVLVGACWLLLLVLAAMPLHAQSSFTVTKKATPSTVEVGEPITFTITIKAGYHRLNDVAVDDPDFNELIDPPFPTVIERGETEERSFTITPDENDIGTHTNTVTVIATPDRKEPEEKTASATVTVVAKKKVAKIEVDKEADTRISKPGDTIKYTITIANSGDVALVDVVVIDSLLGDITPEFFASPEECMLEPGQWITVTLPFDVPEDVPNPLVNRVKVSAVPDAWEDIWSEQWEDENQERIFAEDEEVVRIVSPSVKVTKKANRSSAAVGETITYTITVKNTGDIVLRNIKVIDTLFGNITRKLFPYTNSLEVGKSVTATFQRKVLCSDKSPLKNTVKVTANPDDLPNIITNSATVSVTITGTGGSSTKVTGPDLGIYNSAYANKAGGGIINTTAQGQVQRQCNRRCTPIIYPMRLENRTGKTVSIRITGTAGCDGWKVRYFNARNGGTDITALVTGAGWNPSCYGFTMAPGAARDFMVVITPGSGAVCGENLRTFITATVKETGQADKVEASTTVR